MDNIDWSKAPEWADRVVRSPGSGKLYWANHTTRQMVFDDHMVMDNLHISYNWEVVHLYPAPDAKPEFCESVMRSIPGPDEQVWTICTSIEQLAADYRNAKDYAERKQREADDAKDDADEKLRVLEIAGEALGLLVSPITEKQEPELVAAKFTGKFHSAKHGDRPSDLDMICDGCGKRFGHHVGFECRP